MTEEDPFLDTLEDALTRDEETPSAQRASEIDPADFLSTGNLEMNWAISGSINGGYPIGRITALAGESFTGKSVSVQRAVAMAQKKGGRALVNDSENAYSPSRMEGLGVDLDKVSLVSTQTIEEHHATVMKFLDVVEGHGSDAPVVLALDSLGDLSTEQEMDHGLEKQTVGALARQLKKHLRIVGNRMADLPVCYIIVQHVFQNIGQQFGDTRQPGGGEGPKYRSSVQIMLNSTDESETGVTITGKTIKTRLAPRPGLSFEFFVPWDEEPSDYGGIIPMGMRAGFLQKNGRSLDVVNPETGEIVAEKAVKAQKTNPDKRAIEEDKLVEAHPEVLEWLE